MLITLATLSCLFYGTAAQSSSSVVSTSTAPASSSASKTSSVRVSTGVPSITISTAIPSATAPLDTPLASQVPLPPHQAWCPSEIFCAGALLQTVNLAHLFPDDKTFIDKPTSKSAQLVLADFRNISTANVTYGQIEQFVENNFAGEGLELQAVELSNFTANPPFLNNVSDPLVKAWSKTVHGYWNLLIRSTNESAICRSGGKCESSLIPLNHTFVVPGGRFREQYYWDSYWIVEGLIESQLHDIVNATLQNFMDELEQFGFIPNGGRIYYLDRSQPPLFIQIVSRYVTASGDRSILRRALPLAEKELKWWDDNRSINVTSPFTNKSYVMHRYAVNNSAPRPESYLTDYMVANGPDVTPPLNETQRSALYAELASGAETGWDFTTRWIKGNNSADLKALEVRNTIPVDLNSILYRNHILLADLYGASNRSAETRHRNLAASIRNSVLDVLWDSEKLAFYDFNLVSKARNNILTAAHFYPFWSGIIPNEVATNETAAFGAFSSLNMVLNRYNGSYPSTFIDTGLQWDAPNAWPPHQHIMLQALRALPANVTTGALPIPSNNQSTFDLIPSGQLGISETSLPGQPVSMVEGSVHNSSTTGPAADLNTLNGTVVNGGNATQSEGWSHVLQRELANRYIASALCSWHATGGSLEGLLPRLPDEELNVTQSINNTGIMFEKFSSMDIDSAGRGGEYTVQAGFGWTNGVALWVASNYGNILVAPQCPNVSQVPIVASGGDSQTGAGGSGGNGTQNNAASFRQLPTALALFSIGASVQFLT